MVADVDMCVSLQPYVTEMDLRHSLIPDDLIEDLLHSMPKHTGPDLEVDQQVPKYDYIGFMEMMAGGGGDGRDDDHGPLRRSVPNGGAVPLSPARKGNSLGEVGVR